MARGIDDDDIADLACVVAELAEVHGDDFDAKASIVRFGRAVRVDPSFMISMRGLAESARLRSRYFGLRGLKPITGRLLDAEQRCEQILKRRR